jgi:hypothetical protein
MDAGSIIAKMKIKIKIKIKAAHTSFLNRIKGRYIRLKLSSRLFMSTQ